MNVKLKVAGVLLLSTQGVMAGTLTVESSKDLSNPDIIAYNLGHFHEDSNTHDWWRYAGVNGARMFISPATLESNDDIAGWGDGEEIFAGSDPKDSDSRFVIPDYNAMGDGSFTVEWPSLVARTYALERTLWLTSGDWDEIYSAKGTGETMSYNDSPGTTNAFYRLLVR